MNPGAASSPSSRGYAGTIAGLDLIVSELRNLFEYQMKVRESGPSLRNPTYQEDLESQRQQHLGGLEGVIKEMLTSLLLSPPHHSRHFDKLSAFHEEARYDDSVFIMTKFPEGDNEADSGLRAVIEAVSKSIQNCGLYPRIASKSDYHPWLWDNVELHLLGCSRGVAIVEDRYKAELNPNVAMEWGWMRAMGKEVLFLMEDGIKHSRADWAGLTKYDFSWDEPECQISAAIAKWLNM